MIIRPLILAAALVILPTIASAQTFLDEGFQDGDADGWQSDARKGKIGLTEYAGNVSLKLTRDAYAIRLLKDVSADHVRISAAFAADSLEGDDACVVEASPDGATWFEIGRVEDGQDDSVTLHTVSGMLDLDGTNLFLGVRITGNAANDTCWVDNISVVGVRNMDALSADLSQDVLWHGQTLTEPVSMQAFAPPDDMTVPMTSYSGTLRFEGIQAAGFELLRDSFNYSQTADTLDKLPAFNVTLVQDGTDLIPTLRGPQANDHPDWEWIIEPGQIWQREDGHVRASLPFALQERNANCVHNGLMAFEIAPHGDTSALIYQIGSETCAYMQFNLWGSAPIVFEVEPVDVAETVIRDYRLEVAHRLPTRPLSDLSFRDQLGHSDEVAPEAMTVLGYIKDGTHYVGPCHTRLGDYPYCDVLDLPSYSWAKSLVAGLASMRLEKVFPGSMNSLITDYVPACDDWDGVTFQHALDMATGRYDSDVYDEDEASEETRQFFLTDRHDRKIDIACNYDRRSAPGKTFVYHTTDTYILGTAITAFLREQTGRNEADIFDDLIDPLWASLGLSPVARQTRRTYDDEAQVFAGWGLTLHRGDIATIARFLHEDGIIEGEPMLDPAMLADALQQRADPVGLRAIIDSQRYKNGFWAWNAGANVGCDDDLFVPAMSGYGGLTLALMPNGQTYYYISDGYAFAWARAANASHNDTPFCEAKP